MAKKSTKRDRKSIPFDYIKSNFFRVIHADGVYGGLGPDLNIHMAIFSERRPIPTEVVYAISEDGTLGDENLSARKVREGFVREVDADVVIDLDTAKTVIKWLQAKVDEGEGIIQTQSARKKNLPPNSNANK